MLATTLVNIDCCAGKATTECARLGNLVDAWWISGLGAELNTARAGKDLDGSHGVAMPTDGWHILKHRDAGGRQLRLGSGVNTRSFCAYLIRHPPEVHPPHGPVLDAYLEQARSWWSIYNIAHFAPLLPAWHESMHRAMTAWQGMAGRPRRGPVNECVVHYRVGDAVRNNLGVIPTGDVVRQAQRAPGGCRRVTILSGGLNHGCGPGHWCHQASLKLLDELGAKFRTAFPSATITAGATNATVGDDFEKMALASTLICTSGSFCLAAGIANQNYVRIPAFKNQIFTKLGCTPAINMSAQMASYPPSGTITCSRNGCEGVPCQLCQPEGLLSPGPFYIPKGAGKYGRGVGNKGFFKPCRGVR